MDPEKAAIIANSDDDHEEIEEEEEADNKMDTKDEVASVLRNPQVMAALQARLDSMVGNPSGYVKVHESKFCWVNFL